MSEFVNVFPLGFRLQAKADSPGRALISGGWPKAVDKSSVVGRGPFDITNRPFYRYGGHIELIGFKEYYWMPRGQSDILATCIYARFSGQFFFKFS